MNAKNSCVVQFRMDSELKESFENIVKNMGLDMGSAFRIFAMQVLRTRKIPFEIEELSSDTAFTKENEKEWIKARKELERGEAISLSEFKQKYGR